MSKLHPLKLKRLEKGLSQHALSFETGVPQVRICYAEKGYPALNQKQKELLAKILECKPEDLFPLQTQGQR
jgi:transcriptional regulator with XRE-family HTH domain